MSDAQTISAEVANEGGDNTEMNQESVQENQAKPSEEVVPEKMEPEAKPENADEPKVEEKPKDRLAPKFAALSRKEKAIRQREIELEQRLKEYEAKSSKLSEIERLKRENPLKFLEENGLSYEDLTKAILNNGELTEEQKERNVIVQLQEEINGLKQSLKESQEKQAEREAQEQEAKHTQTIENFKNDIKNLIETEEKYELSQKYENSVEEVFSLIRMHYDQTGEVLEIDQAADLLEQELEEQAKRLLQAKKLSQFIQPPKEDSKQSKAPSDSPNTLENALSSQVPNRQATKLSDDELIAQAASLIKWAED